MLRKFKEQHQLDLRKKKPQTLSNELMSLIWEGNCEDCDRILGACSFS